MTKLLESAIEKARELPPEEQDVVASILLEEMEDEARWRRRFAESQDELSNIAARVRADIRAGKTANVGIDEL